MTSEDVLHLADQLRPLLLRLNRKIRAETGDSGLSTIQVSILMGVHLHPGQGLGILAQREGIQGPTLIEHLNKLEKLGHLQRSKPLTGDQRRTVLTLTPSGELLLQQVKSSRSAWLASRLAGLDPEQQQVLSQALEPLQKLLEEP